MKFGVGGPYASLPFHCVSLPLRFPSATLQVLRMVLRTVLRMVLRRDSGDDFLEYCKPVVEKRNSGPMDGVTILMAGKEGIE